MRGWPLQSCGSGLEPSHQRASNPKKCEPPITESHMTDYPLVVEEHIGPTIAPLRRWDLISTYGGLAAPLCSLLVPPAPSSSPGKTVVRGVVTYSVTSSTSARPVIRPFAVWGHVEFP